MWNPFKKRVAPPIESLSDEALIALAAIDRATFDSAEGLLGWLCEHAGIFDRTAETRPELRPATGIVAFANWADDQDELARALAQERTETWSLIGHGEQTYLYWDRSALPEPRVIELDHEQRMGGLVMHAWLGKRALLLGMWARWAKAPGVDVRSCYCSLAHHGSR